LNLKLLISISHSWVELQQVHLCNVLYHPNKIYYCSEEFDLNKWPQKLKEFWVLSFEKFIKALKIKKSELSISKKDEILELFEKYKKELIEIKKQIDMVDTEINKMTFELYELSENERRIVLKNLT